MELCTLAHRKSDIGIGEVKNNVKSGFGFCGNAGI